MSKQHFAPVGGSDYSGLPHLVDGDIIAYRCAAATDGRHYTVGKERFRYKKEATKYATENNRDLSEVVLAFDPEPESHAIKLMKDIYMNIPNPETYLSDKRNFRYDIFPGYKSERKNTRRPANLSACKDWMTKHKAAKTLSNLEADDAVVIRSTEYDVMGSPSVIVSVDKDLLQKCGLHMDPFSLDYKNIDYAQARESLWTQVCVGDGTDGIKSPHGLGPKTAQGFYADRIDWRWSTDREIYEATYELYTKFLPMDEGQTEDDYAFFIETYITKVARLVYLLRYHDDEWTVPSAEEA